MRIPFVKMHGIGNDFVMIDAMADPGLAAPARDLAGALCDRKLGVGADGVIVLSPAGPGSGAEYAMVMYNPDGSVAEMCGNGIRCFAKLIYDRGYSDAARLRVLTGRGVLVTEASVSGAGRGRVDSVRVDMGAPILARRDVPADLPGDPGSAVIDEPLAVGGREYRVTCVSMGNPHCVVFLEPGRGLLGDLPLHEIGPLFERHPAFPKRVNTEFIEVAPDGRSYAMRVWERGAGETLACGTGACAAAVACVLTGRAGRVVTGHLAGGDLRLEWTENGPVLMDGPAVEVFSGEYPALYQG